MHLGGYKIVLLGDTGVGKSSIVSWLFYKRMESPNNATIGASFFSKDFEINGKIMKFNIWDTAGQERYRSLAKIYYRNTAGCFAVFDIGNYESFINLKRWITDYEKENQNTTIIIIANKTDIPAEEWQVKESDIVELCREYDCTYLLTSCIDGKNIQEAFEHMGKEIIEKNKYKPDLEYQLPIVIHNKKSKTECTQCY